MIIRSAVYVKSSTELRQCPPPDKPEYAFIGRSNVGKSSLINMITGIGKLARVSGTPGKTQTINHYLVNDEWYLTDLPGYGYARVSQKMREQWNRMIMNYITRRDNLISLFVLIDSRHEPIASDMEFMEKLAMNCVPFARVFTKADKAGLRQAEKNKTFHDKTMLATWESLPPTFMTSAAKGTGRDELLDYISDNMKFFKRS